MAHKNLPLMLLELFITTLEKGVNFETRFLSMMLLIFLLCWNECVSRRGRGRVWRGKYCEVEQEPGREHPHRQQAVE